MEPEKNIQSIAEQKLKQAMHYHGDELRVTFLIMVIILVIGTPFFKYTLVFKSFAALLAIVFFVVFAGLTNPKSKAVIIIDFIISIFSVLLFGSQTILIYTGNIADLFFLTNLVLFVLSIFALYFSSKTLRGNLLYKAKQF